MDSQTVGTLVAIMTPLVLAGVWLLRLEGRINTHERGCEERQKLLDERHAQIQKSLEDLHTKFDRLIEGRLP